MQINPKSSEAYRLLHDGVLALSRAEQAGIRVDIEYAEDKKTQITGKIKRLESALRDTKFYRHWAHVTVRPPNIHSNAQLSKYLYVTKKLEPAKLTTTGHGSTEEDALRQLNIPELDTIIKIRKLRKIRDTYLDAFLREQVHGYIHPFYSLHLVRTFRSSSDRPNFQNIPKRDHEAMQITRRALYPRPGHHLLSLDFKQLEVRIATCYHKDPTMLKYNNDPASDMHSDMARQIFMLDKFDKTIHKTLRDATKNGFVFPQFYGDYYGNNAPDMACHWGGLPQGRWKPGQGIKVGDTTLGDHLISKGIKSLDAFTDHVKDIEDDFWNNRFPDYAAWKKSWWKVYQRYGYISMLTGFNCSGVMSRNDCINYPIQGSAFHCLLWSLTRLDTIMREERWDSRIVGQIHDELTLDVHPDELEHVQTTARRVMCEELPEAWKWIIVPLEIDAELRPLDGSWADKCA